MRDAILPWAVMAVTIIVAIGLMGFFRHLLKLREDLAPEVVHPTAQAVADAEATKVTLARYNLAA